MRRESSITAVVVVRTDFPAPRGHIFMFVSPVHVRLIVEKNLPKKFATSQIGPLTHYPATYNKEGSDRNSVQSIQQIILTSNCVENVLCKTKSLPCVFGRVVYLN